MSPEQVEMLEVQLVLDAIHQRYGYDFRGYALDSMQRRLESARIRLGASSLGELQHSVLTNTDYFVATLEHLTVRVSDVFRDPEFYLAFRELVVPTLRTYPTIKLWLAGCANGEEVYSIAIALQEEGLLARSTLYATDISLDALREAKAGVYAASRLDSFRDNYVKAGGLARFDDYCSVGYERVAMSEALKQNVVFFHHDLVSDYSLGEMNVVLCRNVLIYFGAELRLRTLGLLRGCLCHGGFLCLGMSEALPEAVRGSFEVVSSAARVFRSWSLS